MATNSWDLRGFVDRQKGLNEAEKKLCFQLLDEQGFSDADKEDAFFKLNNDDLKDAGITLVSTRKVLLLAIEGAAAGLGLGSAAGADDVVVRRADVSRKFTGQVMHEVQDPKAGEARQVPSCVIVIASEYAATFAHHRNWVEGQDVELKICSTDTTSMRVVKAKVFYIDPKVDFVILKFTGEELQAPDAECGPRDGMKFYGHGLSCPRGTANVYHGVVARAEVVGRGHIALDSRLSGKGDSGGGIFSATTGRLLGMMVGRDKDLKKSYMIPAAVLLAAAVEDTFDPDPDPS